MKPSLDHHHPYLLHRQALVLDRLLTFLMTFSTLVSKPSFSRSLSHSHLYLAQAHLEFEHSVFGSYWWWQCWSVRQIKPASTLIFLTYFNGEVQQDHHTAI